MALMCSFVSTSFDIIPEGMAVKLLTHVFAADEAEPCVLHSFTIILTNVI